MAEHTRLDDGASPDRRTLLKKAGIVGAGIWAAPMVTSLTSPAFAVGSEQPPSAGNGCIVLESNANVQVAYTASACNTLAFGLVGGAEVCSNCSNNSAGSGNHDFGTVTAGTGLTFYFEDNGFGSCCTRGYSCDARYECGTGTTHVRVDKISDTSYKIYFLDAGCECARVAQDASPSAGPGSANIEVTVTITPQP